MELLKLLSVFGFKSLDFISSYRAIILFIAFYLFEYCRIELARNLKLLILLPWLRSTDGIRMWMSCRECSLFKPPFIL